MNRIKRELDSFIGDTPRFKEELKRKILIEMKKSDRSHEFSKKSFHTFKYAAILTLLLIVTTSFLFLVLNENDQKLESGTTAPTDSLVVKDSDTVPEIETYTAYDEPLELLSFKSDTMDRGNHEYIAYPLLINPQAYKEKDISRGDVIAYEYDFFDGKQMTVSRVIGLPGETIEIKESQIYIDEKKLDTFYGKAHRTGIGSNEEYNEALKANGAVQNIDSMKEIFSQSTEKFQLGENEVFLVGDDWFIGVQHTLAISEIYGEVVGYYK